MENTRRMSEGIDRKVFISRQSRHFSITVFMTKVLFSICALAWRVINYVSRQGNVINKRNQSIFVIRYFFPFWLCRLTVPIVTIYFLKVHISRCSPKLIYQIQIFQFSLLLSIFLFKKMATIRNKRKLAAVLREAQGKHPRNVQSRNTRINMDYITQVSAEIEGRDSKKLSRKFSRTKYRILGALSKLDKFLLNPQMYTLRNCSENIPEHWRGKRGTNWGSFPEWSPFWSRALCLSVLQFSWLRPRKDLSQVFTT